VKLGADYDEDYLVTCRCGQLYVLGGHMRSMGQRGTDTPRVVDQDGC
jgi:hypothetical protein